jgi:hypothetical protein
MPSDLAFLRQRLAFVERWLANPDQPSAPIRSGRLHPPAETSSRPDLTYKREARLLRKLLARSREGHVLTTLQAWRRQLGGFLREHRNLYKAEQDAWDQWWELPRDKRVDVPKPPRPPSARYVDRDGAPWIVDDRFLALLDDLVERLNKWLSEE